MTITTTQDMFSLYTQIIGLLGYPQHFEQVSDFCNCCIDELAGFIAQTDSELNKNDFFNECDRINETITSLGYEV